MKRRSPEKRKKQQATEERGRRSPRGKAKLKEKYEERKRWLDELKAERACCLCGEKNPLESHLRDSEKAKFTPELKNLSRSKKDRLGVIRRCDVFCLNCLAKKKPRRKSGRKLRRTGEEPEISWESAVNASLRGDFEGPRQNHGHSCGCCQKPLERAKQKFCSPRCRLLHWAAKEIFEAYRGGQADGLAGIVAKLGEVQR